jgi:hypothetical protein
MSNGSLGCGGCEEEALMQRVVALAGLLAMAAPVAATQAAAPPGPTCRLPAVVDVAAQALRLNPRYAHIEPQRIRESPTADPRVVRCDLCLTILHYDTDRFGETPAAHCEARGYSVRAVRNGFVVQLAR